jgi:uncharacterized membrane protein (DUF2068 family)
MVIGTFKLAKAAMLVALALGLLQLLERGPREVISPWLEAAHADARGRIARKLAERLFSLDHRHLQELAVATFAYAAVFVVEGIGLLLRKTWAEYLTLGVTISFLPFEVIEIAHQPSPPKWLTLVLNVAVVVYLVARRIADYRSNLSSKEGSIAFPAATSRSKH